MSLPDMTVAEAGSRPMLVPQGQTSAFQYMNTSLAPQDAPQQRNYVFVDEHNRHKRLKVMRACEGCRRRKIKCDAATTNSWPCAACTRLKLNCIPPTVSYEKDSGQPGVHTFELQGENDYPTIPVGTISDYQRPQPMSQAQYAPHHGQSQTYEPLTTYAHGTYLPPTTTSHESLQFGSLPTSSMATQEMNYHNGYTSHPVPDHRQNSLDTTWKSEIHPAVHRANSLDSSSWNRNNVDITALRQNSLDGAWKSDVSLSPSADALSEAMGGLKIDHLAVAPYIADRNKLAETPALAEFEIELPHQVTSDQRVQIPPEMMPNEEQALQYFQYFFAHIHPYVPVLNRQSFYQQWSANRESISPLLLEAIFACTTMTLEDHAQGNKWLALATRHEESFKDVPRLSTIQASLILLKARESAPKRGYFYRSWMTVVNVAAMAKDLDIHEHKFDHAMGQPCNSTVFECVAKTRIWQTLYVLETMIGGPQGRNDFAVDAETVDFNPPPRMPGLDEIEFSVSFQFVYFTRLVKNIRGTINIYQRLKRTKKDWYLDPDFVGHDQIFPKWLRELPQSLLVPFPEDGSMPYLPNSFIGNMNCYHYLSLVMHHRPQIHYMTATEGNWRQHMILCHDAAKKMCRLQESVLHNFGIPGMMCMQRGISFTIYCVLTCTMLHLASITSPDPELNCEARDYFIRHMRILEQTMHHWPMPEVHAQINGLREAFSVDTTKPFELKPSFPFGSPRSQNASPDGAYNQPHLRPIATATYGGSRMVSMEPSSAHVTYTSAAIVQHPITPPVSTTDEVPKADSPVVQSLAMIGSQAQSAHPSVQGQEAYPAQWNPTKIFDQWSAAFGTPASSTTSQPSPPQQQRPPPGNFDVRANPDNVTTPYHSSAAPTSYSHESNLQAQIPANLPVQVPAYSAPANGYVTPTMWQEVVANSLVDGRKRVWDYGGNQAMAMDAQVKRQQR